MVHAKYADMLYPEGRMYLINVISCSVMIRSAVGLGVIKKQLCPVWWPDGVPFTWIFIVRL